MRVNIVVFVTDNIIFCHQSQVEAAKATDLPDTDTKTAEPDPAETWKKDFQCQWYKTEDQDVLDLQSPKDGVSLGGTLEANAGGVTETTTTATTKRASVTEFSGSSTAGTGTAPSLEASTDKGTNSPSAPSITVLLLLVVGSLSLKP